MTPHKGTLMAAIKKAFPWFIVIAGLIAVLIILGIVVLSIMGRAVPPELWAMGWACLTTFLGGKLGTQNVEQK